jgi:hypothetical protein
MLIFKERRPAIRTLRGWAISVLQEAGAIRECEEHGWMQDRADPHARERIFDIERRHPPAWALRRKPPPRSATCWIRSATLARSVRRPSDQRRKQRLRGEPPETRPCSSSSSFCSRSILLR